MKKSTKTFTGSVAALASVASIIAPAATVLAAEKTATEVAVDHVVYAEKTLNFFDFNLAFSKVVALGDKNPQYFELLARLSKIENTVKTPEIKAILTAMDDLAANKDLANYTKLEILINDTVKEEKNNLYLRGELDTWGRGMVYTADVQAAINAIVKAQAEPTVENLAAAKAATALVKNAGSLAWLNEQVELTAKLVVLNVESIKAVGAKKLEVKFNKAVEDASKLTLTVKRDGITINAASTEWNADKTVATITASYNLQSGKYVATAKYDTADATSTPEAQIDAAKVSKITFASPSAVMSTDKKNIVANVKIYNQYGEDVTSSISLSDLNITASKAASGSSIAFDKGKITVTDTADYAVDQKVVLTVVHKATAVVAYETLNVVQSANISSITIGDVATDDADLKGKAIFVGNDLTKYYIPVEVKDQYGNVLKAADLASFTKLSSNPNILQLGSFADKDGKVVLNLAAATGTAIDGTSVVTLVSSNGVSANKAVEVKANAKIDSLTLEAPTSIIKQGKEITVPFTAVDQYGNALVSQTQLDLPAGQVNQSNQTQLVLGTVVGKQTTISITGGTIKATVDYANKNAVQIKVTPAANAKNVILTVITSTGKVQNITFNVEEAPKPVAFKGLKSDFYTAIQTSAVGSPMTTDIAGKLELKDQYGDTIALSSATGYTVTYTAVDDAFNKFAFDGTSVFTADTTKGTEAVKATLKDADNKVVDEFTFTLEAVELKDLTSFGVDDVKKLYTGTSADAAHNRTVNLYGLKGTTKVKVNQTALIKNASLSVGTLTVTTGANIVVNSVAKNTDGEDKNAKLTVVVEGANGVETIVKDVVYNSAAPSAAKIELRKSDDTVVSDQVITLAIKDSNNVDLVNGKDFSSVGSTASYKFYVEDQYGIAVDDHTFVVTNVTDAGTGAALSASINSTGVVSLTNPMAGDSFTITAVTANGLTRTVKIFLK